MRQLVIVGRGGKAKCLPLAFARESDGKLWFCSNNTMDAYKAPQENELPPISHAKKWEAVPISGMKSSSASFRLIEFGLTTAFTAARR